jgi:predicted Zn-dependent peptidase
MGYQVSYSQIEDTIAAPQAKPADVTIDVTKKPTPLERREFSFPAYTTNSLNNGLKLFFIQDNEQPTVTLRLLIKGGTSQDGEKDGIAEITADMLFKGTKSRTADILSKSLDGVGASFNTTATADYTIISITGLKKHQKLFFDVLLDVLTNPTFPDEELAKMKQLYIASIRQSMSRSATLAQYLANKAVYGENHPYSKVKSIAGIESITREDLLKYFKKFYMPNNATLSLVGQFNNENTTVELRKDWAVWARGTAPTIIIPEAKPMPYGVYFIPRAASVQSSIAVCSKTVPYGSIGFNELALDANVIGGGFAGRLFRTLREQYSYTYSPFGRQSAHKFANMFICGAEVRNTVTDSAIDVTLAQLGNLASIPPDSIELAKVKSYFVGKYLMSFENTDFVADLIQNSDFLDRNMDEVRNYDKIINDMTPDQLSDFAKKYMNPKTSYIIVVGVPEVKAKLQKYGKVYEFTEDVRPTFGENAAMEPVKYSADDLIEKYADACGSLKKMKRAESLVADAKITLEIEGRKFDGTMTKKYQGNKFYQEISSPFIKQTIWIDGKTVRYNVRGNVEIPDSIESEKQIFGGTLFAIAKLPELGYKCKVLGKLNGKIMMKAVSPKGIEYLYYFSAENFLLEKMEQYDMAQGATAMLEENYSDYKEFDGVLMPTVVKLDNPFFKETIEYTYKLNEKIDPAVFVMPKE